MANNTQAIKLYIELGRNQLTVTMRENGGN
jgi:hypothetical protein